MQKYYNAIHKSLNDSSVFLANARQFWSTQGFNDSLNLFEDSLSLNGEKKSLQKKYRLRTQMRQIYVFAQGYAQTGNESYLFKAFQAYDQSQKLFKTPEGFMCNTLDQSSNMIDSNIHCFEQAFVMFASAWLYHVTDEQHYLDELKKTWNYVKIKLNTPANDLSLQQQNSYMHLFEAHLFAHLLTGDILFFESLQTFYATFIQHLFVSEKGVVREHFNYDFTLNEKSNIIEVGHAGEWIYLLHLYSKITGENTDEVQEALYNSLLKSIDEIGFVCDESTIDLNPHTPTKRLWAQCETLKAHLVMFEKKPSVINLKRILNLSEALFKYYISRDKGIWREQLDENYLNIYPSIPATTLYHLNLLFSEFQRILYPIILPACNCKAENI